mmetsp:Transcript_12528/g.37597  ORF Transcript_12528/g.37597 Transcript_12528/m.37597 type:complete len:727 (-) Transcript_12528:1258-3438(-)|eukprot:CAMPEP_0206139354 /NCGR_PEP_ID=MMETSP1473-20131121/5593_1 /ASSEMBLY_ACC=CAM_ASM_001109 /TAXON_ID=1461547 /ORGANISM="Stichococcus sp, Strain RCC1054" /LENGTH=726 /DNA_ID=CAMNT_0053533109 /DNA_START=121 /DNA_END=2301 /DNA_ORIENTATION=+
MVEADESDLSAVFFLSLYTTVLFPYTIYKLLSSDSTQVVKPWVQNGRKDNIFSRAKRFLCMRSTLVLIGLWVIFGLLVYYAQATAKDKQPFDPYGILMLEKGASSADIKRAYRKLSLKYHPDKNPDPAAAQYFAESITKAYKALSDPDAKKNWEEHGHPDGRQSITMGIGLPKWLFDGNSRTAPLLLAALVFGGVLLPLGVAACYLLSSNKFSADGIVEETYHNFLMPPSGLRQSQGLARILETLTIAVEYIRMPLLPAQLPAMEELRKNTLRAHPDIREKKTFWQRKPSCIKANMLLLAHLEREPIHPTLYKDWLYVTKVAAPLTKALVDLSNIPRPPDSCGWLSPAVASIEFLQHLIQAVPLAQRRNAGSYKSTVEGTAPLLQLPHLDGEVAKKLSRRKIRGLADIQGKDLQELREVLLEAGLEDQQAADVETSLSSMPTVRVEAQCAVAGADSQASMMVGDVVTVTARVLLHRPSHATQELSKDGNGVAVFAPHYPHPREEKWFFFVGDPASGDLLSAPAHVSLLEAEYRGAEASRKAQQADTSAGSTADSGPSSGALVRSKSKEGKAGKGEAQVVEVSFLLRSAAKKEYTLFAMCDSWIACDVVLPLHLKVQEQSRAELEGRASRGVAAAAGRVIPLDEDGVPEEPVDWDDNDVAGGSDEDEDGEEEYDSEDSGTEESGSEDEEDVPAAGKHEGDGDDSDGSADSESQRGIVPKSATLQADD